jgi:gluconokinase
LQCQQKSNAICQTSHQSLFFYLKDSAILSTSNSLVIMGVAGCGKSSLAATLAQAHQWPWIEGDAHHSPENRSKMQQGIALTDADRAGWLGQLGRLLTQHEQAASQTPLILTCSALKRSYRDRLRAAAPALRFVFLDIAREEAQARVLARAPQHFFSASLVDSQFATLESPVGEAGVLCLDATLGLDHLHQQVLNWLEEERVLV